MGAAIGSGLEEHERGMDKSGWIGTGIGLMGGVSLLIVVVPGLRFEIHLASRAWDRAGRIPIGIRLTVLCCELFYLESFLPDLLLYHIEAKRLFNRGPGSR